MQLESKANVPSGAGTGQRMTDCNSFPFEWSQKMVFVLQNEINGTKKKATIMHNNFHHK